MRPGWMACVVGLAIAGAGAAGADEHRRCKGWDADIESLKGQMRPIDDGWLLAVRYEVEVEHARVTDVFELELELTECDRRVVDSQGNTIVMIIPMQVEEYDDGELELAGCAEFTIPAAAIGPAGKIKLHGAVVPAGQQVVLDRDCTKVKVCVPPPPPPPVVECRAVEVREVECRPVYRDCGSAVRVHVNVGW